MKLLLFLSLIILFFTQRAQRAQSFYFFSCITLALEWSQTSLRQECAKRWFRLICLIRWYYLICDNPVQSVSSVGYIVIALIPLCGLFLLVARHNQSKLCFCSRFLRRFVIVFFLSHAEYAEYAELPVLESLVHAGAGIHRLCRRLRHDCHAGCSVNRSSANRSPLIRFHRISRRRACPSDKFCGLSYLF